MRGKEITPPGTLAPRPPGHYGTPDFYLDKLEEALGLGDARPEAFEGLLRRLKTIWLDDNRQSVLIRIEQLAQNVLPATYGSFSQAGSRQLPDAMQDQLAVALARLVRDAEKLKASDRVHADRAISRLSWLLTSARAWEVVSPWFADCRAFRSRAVVRVLRHHGIPESHANAVIEQYRATLGTDLLKLISFNPHVAALLQEDDVLRALAVPANDRDYGVYVQLDSDSRYWWMRAIEALLIGGHVPSDAIAFGYPMQFAWAVGRGSHNHALTLLRRVLDHLRDNPEFLWRSMRAFERVGDPEDIQRVCAYASGLVDARSRLVVTDGQPS